jgi:hypothetical protein
MADSDLKIKVTSTADTSGIDDVTAAMRNFQDVANRTGETVQQVQARFAEGPKFVQALTQEATKTAEAFTLTRTEAASLANELVRGEVSARGLGTALSGLGGNVAIAGIAAFALYEVINNSAEATLKAAKAAAEFETALRRDVEQWAQMAQFARSLGDVVNLSSKVSQDLDKMASDMQKFRTEQLAAWKTFWDAIQPFFKGIPGVGTFAGQKQADLQKQQEDLNKATQAGNTEITVAEQKAADYANAVAHLSQGISDYGQKVKDATARLQELDAQAAKDPTNLNVEKERSAALKDLQETQKTYQQLVADQSRLDDANKKDDTSNKDRLATYRELQTVIQGIRQQQQLIQGAPFMGADEKSKALLDSYVAQIQKLQQLIGSLQAQKASGVLDPAQLEHVNQLLQQSNFEVQSLTQKIQGLQAPLRTELTSWAAQWGTTSHQIATTIEQTIGASLQAVNQFLVTGKFNAQALLQQIETLGLQLVEQMLIQRVMAAINAGAAAGQAAVTGPAIAAAFAPAATAVTVATEGQAALTAPASFAAALALIQGMVFAQHGGVIPGHGTGDTVPAMLTPGEFVVNRQSAQAIGYGNLEEMNMYAAGGRVRPGRSFYGDWVWHTNEAGEVVPMQLPSGNDGGLSFDDLINMPWGGGGGTPSSGGTPASTGFTPPPTGGIPFVPPPGVPFVSPVGVRTPVGPQFPTLGGAMPVTGGGAGIWEGMAKLGLHSGRFRDYYRGLGFRNLATYVKGTGFHLASGLGPGPGGAGRGPTRNFASGGMVGGGGASHVHVYPVMDRKAIMKDMASREGAKVIFDVVKGRRIDLGIS